MIKLACEAPSSPSLGDDAAVKNRGESPCESNNKQLGKALMSKLISQALADRIRGKCAYRRCKDVT
jgi:hypothetical protein